jgi:small conductance mechanosensitive channel
VLPFLVSGEDVADWLSEDGARIAGIVAAAVVADFLLHRIVPHALRVAVERQMKGEREEQEVEQRVHTLASVFTGSGRAVIGFVALLTLLPLAGVNITAIVTGFGITGLALALGAQALVRDAINGVFLLVEDQYRKGDVVRIADVTGSVEEMTLRRTLLRDEDGVLHSIPNGTVSVVSNYTRDFARVNVEVRVAYGEDLSRVAGIIDGVGRELAAEPRYRELISEAPKTARIESVGDSGVALTVSGLTRPAARWDVAAALRRRLVDAFVAEGVRVPFPPHVVVTDGAKATDLPEAPGDE